MSGWTGHEESQQKLERSGFVTGGRQRKCDAGDPSGTKNESSALCEAANATAAASTKAKDGSVAGQQSAFQSWEA